jgi:hypothetical protein
MYRTHARRTGMNAPAAATACRSMHAAQSTIGWDKQIRATTAITARSLRGLTIHTALHRTSTTRSATRPIHPAGVQIA